MFSRFLRGFYKHDADTVQPTHVDLFPLQLHTSREELQATLSTLTQQYPHWQMFQDGVLGETIHLTRTTRLCRFVDDVWLTMTCTGDRMTLHAKSQSRVGLGDFGQNRRNILELWKYLQDRLAATIS